MVRKTPIILLIGLFANLTIAESRGGVLVFSFTRDQSSSSPDGATETSADPPCSPPPVSIISRSSVVAARSCLASSSPGPTPSFNAPWGVAAQPTSPQPPGDPVSAPSGRHGYLNGDFPTTNPPASTPASSLKLSQQDMTRFRASSFDQQNGQTSSSMGSWPAPDANGVQLGWIGPSDGSGLHTDPAGNSPSDDDYLAEGEQHHTAPEPAGIAIWMGIALMGGTAVWYRRRRQQQNTVNGNNTVSP